MAADVTGGEGKDLPADEAGWVEQVRRLVGEGRYFAAWDMARAGRARHAESLPLVLLGALALLRSGAVDQARAYLAPVDGRLRTDRMELRAMAGLLREALAAQADGGDPDDATGPLARLMDGLRERTAPPLIGIDDLGTLRLVCEIYREMWRRLGAETDLRRARELALDAFRQRDVPADGVTAAELTWLLGDREHARRLAAAASRSGGGGPASLGMAALLLGDAGAAAAHFATIRQGPSGTTETARLRGDVLRLEAAGLAVPSAVMEALRPPVVVLFAGPSLDAADQRPALFPAAIEGAVRTAITDMLERLDAQIGYSSARIGADLLFTEAMLDRGAEITVMLPYALQDVNAIQAGLGGPVWQRRFRHALALATAVEYGTHERWLGHDVLERFNHRVIEGTARLRAAALDTEPHLVLLWDHAAPAGAGSQSDFMDHWPDPRRLRILDLDQIRSEAGHITVGEPASAPPPSPEPGDGPERVIRTLLFADVVDYSRFGDAEMPAFLAFMGEVAARTPRSDRLQVDTWGDAIHVVAETATALAEWAFALRDAFAGIDARALGLPGTMQVRIGLDAGPAFAARDPLSGRRVALGRHVTRAARIEPLAVPGNIYASHQFVALLTAEQSAARLDAAMSGDVHRDRWTCEYLGQLPLAKGYGEQPVYHLLPLAGAELCE